MKYKKDLNDAYEEPVSLPQSAGQVDVLRAKAEKRKALRRECLGNEVADVFFGDEEVYDDFNLKRMTLFYDPSLSMVEKQASIKNLEEGLPTAIRERKKRENDVRQQVENAKGRT